MMSGTSIQKLPEAMKGTVVTTSLLLALTICGRAGAQEGYAMRCNGATDYLEADAYSDAINDFTMETWLYPAAPHEVDRNPGDLLAGMHGQRYAIYPTHGTAAWGAGHAGAGFSAGTNGISVYEHAEDYMPAVLTWEGSINGWAHVAVVYRNRTPMLYINGTLVKTGAPSTQAYIHPSGGNSRERRWMMGGIGGGPYGYFQGAIDNVRIWRVARTAEEIGAGMNSEPAASAALMLNYDMNRTGEGRGLEVSNAANGRFTGITVGTAVTPVFEPVARTHRQTGPAPGIAGDVHRPDASQSGETGDRVSGIDASAAGTATLGQCRPNPCRDGADIDFEIPTEGHVRLSLFDAAGREIATLVDEERGSGRHTVHVGGTQISSNGTYLYRLVWKGAVITRTMTVTR